MTCIGAYVVITRPVCVRDHVKEVFLPTLSLQLIFFLLSDFDLDFTHAKRRKSPGNFSEKETRMDKFFRFENFARMVNLRWRKRVQKRG